MPYEGWKSVALPDAAYAKLEAKAKREKRSVSNMALLIIEEGLDGLTLNQARILSAYLDSEDFVAPKPYPDALREAFEALFKSLERKVAD